MPRMYTSGKGVATTLITIRNSQINHKITTFLSALGN